MEKKSTPSQSNIFLVSDSTGETAEKIFKAAVAQFTKADTVLHRKRYIRSDAQIEEVLEETRAKEGLIIFTFVAEALRMKMRDGALQSSLLAVDILGPVLTAMSRFLHKPAHSEPGRLHRIDTDYFGRVEAVQFTVKHDDGQNLHGVPHADIVLVGPSRTAKTPLSIYLARFGYKVANIPIILNLPLQKVLEDVNPSRVLALIIDPQRLMELRTARLKKLKLIHSNYANMDKIIQELKYCRKIYRQHPLWEVIDVTGRAIEEVATDVMTWIRDGNS